MSFGILGRAQYSPPTEVLGLRKPWLGGISEANHLDGDCQHTSWAWFEDMIGQEETNP
jgi:hypothetical protein